MGQKLAAGGGLNPVEGMMLAGNASNSTPPVGLEENGVNTDMWPQNWENTRLPSYHAPEPVNESEYNNTLDSIEEDYDFYNRKKLRDAGVNLGSWFWEDPDMDAPVVNETAPPSPEEEAADEELEAILSKMENATSPEQRLARAGIKIEGMPWDAGAEWDEDDEDNEDDEDGEDEEPAEDAAAAEKSRPMSLKMRKQMQLKQMHMRQHKLQLLAAMQRPVVHHPVHKPISHKMAHKGFVRANSAYQQGLAAYKHYRKNLLEKKLLLNA